MKQLIGIAIILWMVWTPVTCWAKVPLSSTAFAGVPHGFWGGGDDDDDDDGAW